jgi:hypothetical protein
MAYPNAASMARKGHDIAGNSLVDFSPNTLLDGVRARDCLHGRGQARITRCPSFHLATPLRPSKVVHRFLHLELLHHSAMQARFVLIFSFSWGRHRFVSCSAKCRCCGGRGTAFAGWIFCGKVRGNDNRYLARGGGHYGCGISGVGNTK